MGNTQERCCHGRSESSASQRTIVEAEASLIPRSTTRRCSSAPVKRESGSPWLRGSSQASALTRATSSGGKTPRAARPRLVREAFEPPFTEPSSPLRDGPRRAVKPTGDLGIGQSLRRIEDDPRPLHLPEGGLQLGREPLQLRALTIAQGDLVRATARHDPGFDPLAPTPPPQPERTYGTEHLASAALPAAIASRALASASSTAARKSRASRSRRSTSSTSASVGRAAFAALWRQ